MRLFEKFTSKFLHAQKLELGAGIIILNTIISTLAFKHYSEHRIIKDRVTRIASISKEKIVIKQGYNRNFFLLSTKIENGE